MAGLQSYSPRRLNQLPRLHQLLPQGPNVYIHRPALPIEGVAPDPVQQLVPGENHVLVFQEHLQNLVFLQRQRHVLSIHPDHMASRAHIQRAHRILRLALLPSGAAQQSPHSSQKLHHPKGLGHIVIRSCIQPNHLIIFRSLGREHHHRNPLPGASRPDFPENLQAVLLRKHDVQHNELGNLLLQSAPKGSRGLKSPGLQAGII